MRLHSILSPIIFLLHLLYYHHFPLYLKWHWISFWRRVTFFLCSFFFLFILPPLISSLSFSNDIYCWIRIYGRLCIFTVMNSGVFDIDINTDSYLNILNFHSHPQQCCGIVSIIYKWRCRNEFGTVCIENISSATNT